VTCVWWLMEVYWIGLDSIGVHLNHTVFVLFVVLLPLANYLLQARLREKRLGAVLMFKLEHDLD
jgi:hypothetical protein